MKFILSTVAAVVFMIGTANAQHGSAHSAFGIKGGANFYNLNSDPDNDAKTLVGFNAGVLGHIHLSKMFAFQPEVVYSSQGARVELPGDDAKIKLGYINVPMMVQYMFDNGFRIEAGPQVGFLISGKQEIGNAKIDIKDNLSNVDFGVGAGLSYVHPKSGLGIDARYNLGLTNIAEGGGSAKNRGAQVGLFYLFHRAGK